MCLPISPSGQRRRLYLERVSWAPMQKGKRRGIFPFVWSGRRVSNSRPQPWQGCALPTELLPRNSWRREPESNRPTRICNPVHNRFAIAPRLPFDRYRKNKKPQMALCKKPGAAEESRTLDLNLGKVALYQLSYCRKSECALYSLRATCQRFEPILQRYSDTARVQAFLSCPTR